MSFKPGDRFYLVGIGGHCRTGAPVNGTESQGFHVSKGDAGVFVCYEDGNPGVAHCKMDSRPQFIVRVFIGYLSDTTPPVPPKRSPPLVLEIV